MPGMPATGLGGIFYALLILFITARGGWRRLRRCPSRQSWRQIARLGAMLGLILLAFYLAGWAIERGDSALNQTYQLAPDPERVHAVQALVPQLALVPFAILSLVVTGVWLLGFIVWRRERRRLLQATEQRDECSAEPVGARSTFRDQA